MSDSDQTQTILFVGIAERDGLSAEGILLNSNWRVHRAGNCQDGLEFLDRHHVSVVLSESQLPDGSWRELLNGMASLSVPPNLIVSSRLADDRLWAEVLSLGGFDVLMTPFEAKEVVWVTSAAGCDWERKNPVRPLFNACPAGTDEFREATNQTGARTVESAVGADASGWPSLSAKSETNAI